MFDRSRFPRTIEHHPDGAAFGAIVDQLGELLDDHGELAFEVLGVLISSFLKHPAAVLDIEAELSAALKEHSEFAKNAGLVSRHVRWCPTLSADAKAKFELGWRETIQNQLSAAVRMDFCTETRALWLKGTEQTLYALDSLGLCQTDLAVAALRDHYQRELLHGVLGDRIVELIDQYDGILSPFEDEEVDPAAYTALASWLGSVQYVLDRADPTLATIEQLRDLHASTRVLLFDVVAGETVAGESSQ